jgi:hypothetical protein
MAVGWSPWLLRGNEQINREPEYKLEDTNLSRTRFRAHSGRYSQKWFTTWGTHTAGMYQRVQVAPGTPLTFTIWVQVYTGEADGFDGTEFLSDKVQPGNYRVWAGIDPTGAVPGGIGSPPPASVVWSEAVMHYDEWIQLRVSTVAQANAVTVYVKSQPEFAVKHNDSFWDDACLVVDPAARSAPPTSGTTQVVQLAPAAPAPAPPAAGQAVARPNATAVEWSLPGGRFYTQTGEGRGGYSVVDDGEARFWSEFQRLGGLQTIGYPISQRYVADGFVTQAFQKLVLQWRADVGQAWPVNVFDELSKAGQDTTLLQVRQTPRPLGPDFDPANANFQMVTVGRQALLNANPALRARYFAAPDPLTVFGLPTSRVEDMGNHYAIRLQRAVLQQWKETVPWAAAGQVTVANGGDIARELGWLPGAALQPQPVQ